MSKKLDLIKVLIVFLVSPFLIKVLEVPIWIALIMLCLWFLTIRFKNKIYWLILAFLILVIVNLYVNRLLYFDINTERVNFDLEQSFLKYPGVGESIVRYKQEGLWLPYFLRKIFYSPYLIIFSWVSLVFKLLSPIL
jgi:hypothetical protein